jgi:hypothetical protein
MSVDPYWTPGSIRNDSPELEPNKKLGTPVKHIPLKYKWGEAPVIKQIRKFTLEHNPLFPKSPKNSYHRK